MQIVAQKHFTAEIAMPKDGHDKCAESFEKFSAFLCYPLCNTAHSLDRTGTMGVMVLEMTIAQLIFEQAFQFCIADDLETGILDKGLDFRAHKSFVVGHARGPIRGDGAQFGCINRWVEKKMGYADR